eukprot:4113211-Lingulodinium_polyedra.AAC.1
MGTKNDVSAQDEEPEEDGILEEDATSLKYCAALQKVRKARADFLRMEPDLECRIKQFIDSPYLG